MRSDAPLTARFSSRFGPMDNRFPRWCRLPSGRAGPFADSIVRPSSPACEHSPDHDSDDFDVFGLGHEFDGGMLGVWALRPRSPVCSLTW